MILFAVALSFVVCVTSTVESVSMRNVSKRIDRYEGIKHFNFFSDPAKPTVAVEAPQVPTYIDPLMLDIGEQLALLKLKRNESAAAVYNCLIKNGAAHPDIRYFRALVNKGLAARNSDNRFHAITIAGQMAVEPLILQHCNRLGVHVAIYTPGYSAPLKCSCGWRSNQYLRRSSKLNRDIAFERHVQTAEQISALKAAMKPPGMEAT